MLLNIGLALVFFLALYFTIRYTNAAISWLSPDTRTVRLTIGTFDQLIPAILWAAFFLMMRLV